MIEWIEDEKLTTALRLGVAYEGSIGGLAGAVMITAVCLALVVR